MVYLPRHDEQLPLTTGHFCSPEPLLLRSSNGLGLLLHDLLDRWAVDHALVPGVALGVFLLPLGIKALAHDEWEHAVPWDEHQVCIADLVADKVLLAALGQLCIDDAEDSLDLVAVAVNGRSDVLLGVELRVVSD